MAVKEKGEIEEKREKTLRKSTNKTHFLLS
jgi:hypothetical protein